MSYSDLSNEELDYAIEVTNAALVALTKRQKFYSTGRGLPEDLLLRSDRVNFYGQVIEHLREEFDQLLSEQLKRGSH